MIFLELSEWTKILMETGVNDAFGMFGGAGRVNRSGVIS